MLSAVVLTESARTEVAAADVAVEAAESAATAVGERAAAASTMLAAMATPRRLGVDRSGTVIFMGICFLSMLPVAGSDDARTRTNDPCVTKALTTPSRNGSYHPITSR